MRVKCFFFFSQNKLFSVTFHLKFWIKIEPCIADFSLDLALVIKRLARSVVNKLKRSSVARASVDDSGTKAEFNLALMQKGSGFDDQSNQVHIMTARSDMGISNDGLQMQLIHIE